MARRYKPTGNLGVPWSGLLTQQARTRRGAWEPTVSRNVSRLNRGRLEGRTGYELLDYELSGSGLVVEGIWPFSLFGGGVELVHYWDRNFYHATPTVRSGAPSSVSATNPSEGADTLTSYYNSGTATVDDLVLVPPSAVAINRYLLCVNGWDVNQANYGGGWVRQCIQPPPDQWSYGGGTIWTRVLGLPDSYRLGVRLASGVILGSGFSGRPPHTWRVWAAYYDSSTGRYSNPCNPMVLWTYGTSLIGSGSPHASLTYETTGSDDPSVDEVHFFRSSRDGTKGYRVSVVANTSGTVTSGQDKYADVELFALPVMETDNYPAPIARHAFAQKGTVFLGGGFDVDLTGNFAVLQNGSRVVNFFSDVLNESFVGTGWRFGSETRTYYCASVRSATQMLLTEDYAGASATLAPKVDGFDDVVRWNKAPYLHKWPGRNQIVIRGEAAGEGPQGRITGFGEHGGSLLIFQRRQGWRLDWSADPALESGAYLNRIPGLSGMVSARTFIRFGDNLCGWLGEDGWVMYDGVQARVVTDNRLQDWFSALHKVSLPRAWAVHLRSQRLVLIGVRVADPVAPETVAGWPDTILALDYTSGEWDIYDGFSHPIGAACVCEISGEEHVILAQSGAVPPPVSFGRGTLDGVQSGSGLDLDGTVDSVTGGGLICNVTGTLLASNALRGAKVEFLDGALAGVDVQITASTASSFTVDTVGALAGDTYRIGGTSPQFRMALPWPVLEYAQQILALSVQFEVQSGTSRCQFRLYRNGQLWLDSDDEDNFTEAGWRVQDSVVEVDMTWAARAGDLVSTVRVPLHSVDDYEPTDVWEVEITATRANQVFAIIAVEFAAQALEN